MSSITPHKIPQSPEETKVVSRARSRGRSRADSIKTIGEEKIARKAEASGELTPSSEETSFVAISTELVSSILGLGDGGSPPPLFLGSPKKPKE